MASSGGGARNKQPRARITSAALVKAYRVEAERQQDMVRRAQATRSSLSLLRPYNPMVATQQSEARVDRMPTAQSAASSRLKFTSAASTPRNLPSGVRSGATTVKQ